MQTTEAENQNCKAQGDEDSIIFRSSPNFIHMKKYMKSKFAEASYPSPANGVREPRGSSVDEPEKVGKSSAGVQPPLPPNPPPPDSPSNITLKKEIEDDDYQINNSDMSDANQTEELITKYKTDHSEVPLEKKEQETMCRNYIRGTCTRGASCIFAHKLIVSQLPGVYRFCNDFQNGVCSHRKCKFVHATIFEKEYFLREGFIPPHALSHLKEANNILQPPPPPPPAEGLPAAEVAPIFKIPAPPQIHSVTPIPILSCTPAANIESRTVNDVFRSALPVDTSPLKREWSDLDDFGNSPRDSDCGESQAKKCKNCDINEFRLQYNKNKVEKMVRASEDLNKKINQLSKKSNKLFTVLVTLIKPLKSAGANGLLNINGDKETAIMEQLNLLLPSSNRLSLLSEDTNKNMLSSNMNISNLLAKLLRSARDPSLSPDAS